VQRPFSPVQLSFFPVQLPFCSVKSRFDLWFTSLNPSKTPVFALFHAEQGKPRPQAMALPHRCAASL
jgi:hypothetical protein